MISNITHQNKSVNLFYVFFLMLMLLSFSQKTFALPASSTSKAAPQEQSTNIPHEINTPPPSSKKTISTTAKTDNEVANFGMGVELDGVDDWVNIPDITLTNDFTVEGWVKLALGIDTQDALFGQEGKGADINFYQGKARLFDNGDKIAANTALTPDTWGHIAITRSGSQLTLYVNGERDATSQWGGVLSLKAIGRGNRGFLKGMVDEIRVWNIARTKTEINASFNAGVDPNTAGLIGYWTFNNTDQIVTDASSLANHGLLGASTVAGDDDPKYVESTAPFAKIRTKKFVVMQSLLFDKNKPSNEKFLNDFGISYLAEVGHGFAKNWDIPGGANPFYDPPSEKHVKEWASKTKEPIAFIDIEHLPVTFNDDWDDDWNAKTPAIKITDIDRNRAIEELISIADWAHEANSKLIVGYYDILPQKEYWAFVQPTRMNERLKQLQERNKKFKVLAEHVDVIFPSIYTFYNNPDEWKIYAKGMLDEARQYNKPIYAFIWPLYHSSNSELGGQFIGGEFWRLQLETIHKLGYDGVIIWGGYKKQWNESTSDTDPKNWWYQTLAFMHSKGWLPADSTWKPSY